MFPKSKANILTPSLTKGIKPKALVKFWTVGSRGIIYLTKTTVSQRFNWIVYRSIVTTTLHDLLQPTPSLSTPNNKYVCFEEKGRYSTSFKSLPVWKST